MALSLALHGLAVVAVGVFMPATTGTPVQTPAMTVDLVSNQLAVAVQPAPASSAPVVTSQLTQTMVTRPRVSKAASKARSAVVRRASSRARASAVAPVVVPAMISPSDMASSAPIIVDSEESMTVAALSSATALAHSGAFVLSSVGTGRSTVQMGDNPRPAYPRAAREAGWAGTVIVQVLVLPDGTVGHITLYQTSGHAILDQAALSAVQRWRFVPAMEGHVSFESVVNLPIRFNLKDAY